MVTLQSTQAAVPERGQLVHVRSRRWLVESVEPGPPDTSPLVALACAEDDAQGETLQVYWDYETDGRILSEEGWQELKSSQKGFDDPHRFGAYLDALRWNCVTATDPRLVQAPFRAGIKLEAYQIEPLRKALRLPPKQAGFRSQRMRALVPDTHHDGDCLAWRHLWDDQYVELIVPDDQPWAPETQRQEGPG